jgi:hypothetical protein
MSTADAAKAKRLAHARKWRIAQKVFLSIAITASVAVIGRKKFARAVLR